MERSVTARRQLRCVMWFSEASIITIAALTSVQITTEQGSIWACGPVAIVAAMETMRVPLAGWAAHLKPLAMFGAFVVMAAISVLTFEGMGIAFERYMNQRVLDVAAARETYDAAMEKQAGAKAQFDQLTAEHDKAQAHVSDLQGEAPPAFVPPAATACGGGTDRNGRRLGQYACKNPAAEAEAAAHAAQVRAHDERVREASESAHRIEVQLKALPKPDDEAVATAHKALEKAAANSTWYRTAAFWFSTPAKDLTPEQFEKFKRIAVISVAGAVATITMLVSFITHATPRERNGGSKLSRAIRAYVARRRKNVVRTVTVEKPTIKTVEVPKVVEVERIVTKHIHVPVDINTHRVVNHDGSLGDAFPLHVVSGGKQ